MGVVCAGCTLYIPDRDAGPHLWVALADPIPPRNEVPLVMLVTRKRYTDQTVILVPGDHPFVRVETSVSYGTLKFVPVSQLESSIARKHIKVRDDLAAALLLRIQQGVFSSPHTVHVHASRCHPIFGMKDEAIG